MIYKDIYNFLLNKASAKEFDIILNLVRHTDWNNRVQIPFDSLAKESDTTIRYTKDVLDKLTSLHKGKRILTSSFGDYSNSYQLLIGKSSIFYSQGDTYCKKFQFLYKQPFQSMTIYAKRLMLTAAMKISSSGGQQAFLPVSDFVFRNEVSSGHIPSRKILMQTLSEINSAFKGNVTASLVSNTLVREEQIHIQMQSVLTETVIHNQTERLNLRKVLFQYGYTSYLSDNQAIEIEKTAKYLFNRIIRYGKQVLRDNGIVSNLLDTLMNTARWIYNQALHNLAKTLAKVENNDLKDGGLSAYFSSILFSVVTEETAKWSNQAESINALIKRSGEGLGKETNSKYKLVQAVTSVLQKWCENWVMTRVHKQSSNESEKTKESIQKNKKLKDYIVNFLHSIEHIADKQSNSIVNHSKKQSFISRLQEQIQEYIDIHNYRIGAT